jgi:hypothetical protein
MSPIDLVLQALTRLGKPPRQTNTNHWQASSPLREDKRPSLSITVRQDGAVLLKDFGGGETKDILDALELKFDDLFPRGRRQNQWHNFNQPDHIYIYRDANGVEVCQALRYNVINDKGMPDKDFRVRHADNGKWIWKKPSNTPLYRLPELLTTPNDEWVFVPEGEKDVDNLIQQSLAATTNIGGASVKWGDEWVQTLAGRRVCLLADNDPVGKKRVEQLGDRLVYVAREVKVIYPNHMGLDDMPQADVSDALLMGHISSDDLLRLAETVSLYEPAPIAPHRKLKFERDELLNTIFPDPVWLVSEIIPEQSLGILAGRPKIGKSWLALQLANAIADGADFLGQPTNQGRVLYLALEDNPRRIQDRLKTQGINPWSGLTFHFGWPDLLAEDGLDRLRNTITAGEYRLTLIDTMSRAVAMRPDDIREITSLWGRMQEIAISTMSCVLIIDHHRKSFGGVDDVIDAVLDATTKTAVSDFIMGLYRPQREKIGTLRATGRDIEDLDLSVKFNGVIGTWEVLGTPDDVGQNAIEEKIFDAIDDLGDYASGQAIIEYIEMAQGYVYQTLARMVKEGKLVKKGYQKPYGRP